MTLVNTRRLIDSSYLVGGIHTAHVKIKSVIYPFKKYLGGDNRAVLESKTVIFLLF